MSPMMIGIALGLAAGIVQFVALQKVVKAMSHRPPTDPAAGTARVLNAMAWIDLAIMPAVGGFVGLMLTDGGTAL